AAARLVFTPEQGGDYRVIASSRDPECTGPFVLRVLTPAKENSQTTAAEFKQSDPLHRVATGQAARSFEVKLIPGKRYVIALASAVFAPQLFVEGPDGRVVVSARGGEPAGDARLEFTPAEAGPYKVIVTSAGPGQAGPFHLGVFAFGKEGVARDDT